MIQYITPNIEKYDSVDTLIANENVTRSIFDSQPELSIKDVLNESFLCIVGEPGMGKSRLLEEVQSSINTEDYTKWDANKFNKENIPQHFKYCIIDALDEVDHNKFFNILRDINHFKKTHPSTNVFFSCRSHYVSTYRQYFASCEGLHYLEIQKLKQEDIKNVIRNFSQNTQDCIAKSPKLFELLRTPRYLNFLIELEEHSIECNTIGDLFEYIVDKSIEQALENYKPLNNRNTKILVQRVLEKIALVIEIGRKDSITKDELYTILDGLTGNMSQMLIANVDLLYFQNRILIDKGNKLKLGNTELQEYLAAKELCRQSCIESVIYDLAVQKELRHIYPNWFDIIPHISYLSDTETFINTIKLLLSYERNLDSEVFARLTKYVEPDYLQTSQKEELFKLLFENFQHNNVYISWRGDVLRLLAECYSTKCNSTLLVSYENLNKIQLYNIYTILEALCKDMQSLDALVEEYWTNAAKELVRSTDVDKQRNAICILDALQDKTELIELSSSFCSWEQDIQNKYIEVTGYGKIIEQQITKIWIEECYKQNPYAINAILYQTDAETIAYIYQKIVEDNKIDKFLNKKGALAVSYDLYLPKQFEIVWDKDSKTRLVMVKIVCMRVQHHYHFNNEDFDRIIRTILLNNVTALEFYKNFEYDWDFEHVLTKLDSSLIDVTIIRAVEDVLSSIGADEWVKDNCIITLVNKIRKDESKTDDISEYLSKYADTFSRWDNSPKQENEITTQRQILEEKYKVLSDKNKSEYEKIEVALILCKNFEYLSSLDTTSFVDFVVSYLSNINLDVTEVKIKGNNTFTISTVLHDLPILVRTLFKLGNHDILFKHRLLIAKSIPTLLCTYEYNNDEIREIYKHIIGDIEPKEKEELVKWWASRADDYMNFHYENTITCITEYGIDVLSYKLEEFVEEYVKCQDINHVSAALKSLELIATDKYCQWTLDKYKSLFDRLSNEDIDSLKMMCNGIMIEKFQDQESIFWRINYLKTHKIKSLDFESGHARAISLAESEMTSQSPSMFRCFMPIAGNMYLDEQMYELFGFTLSFVEDHSYREYAEYLLKQTCLYFTLTGETSHFCRLRSRVDEYNFTKPIYMLFSILSRYEILIMQNTTDKISNAVRLYNRCLEKKYLPIKNEYDLRKYFLVVCQEVQKTIQDEGIYSVVRQDNLSEDFIQRELKNTIINKCSQMGLTEIRIDREVALQDNKRTDILMSYGMCRPIMIELKLLNNKEIQKDDERNKYKKKFVQYTNATNACLSVFWIFDVKKPNSSKKKFNKLKEEYSDLNDTIVMLSDCKCSSETETGMSVKRKSGKK